MSTEMSNHAILTLVEPLIKRLIRRALSGTGIGNDKISHGTLASLSSDDHVQYLLDSISTGGAGIDVTNRVISIDIDELNEISGFVVDPNADFLLIFDTSLGVLNKIKPSNL